MAIRLTSYLKRNRFGIYYFRRAVPFAYAEHFKQREIYRSLRTSNRHEAMVQSQAFGLVTDLLFEKLKVLTKNTQNPIQADLALKMDLNRLGAVKAHVEQDEVETGKVIISHAVDRLSPLLCRPGMVTPTTSGKRLSDAVKDYLDEFERSGRRPQSVLDYRGDFNQMIQILGDVPVASLRHEELNMLKKTLTALPPHMNKAKELRGKTIEEVLALQLPAQFAATVQKKWSRLQAFLEWAVGQGYVDKNYAKGKKPKAESISREKFSDDDLGLLFECSHYSDALYEEPFQYWIPLIAAYTGARLEEIAQFHLADIKCDVETDIWCFNITEEVDEVAGADTTKSLKNVSSVRVCPMHSQLKAAGLLGYVNDLRDKGYDRLFPGELYG
jgi:hypothetical protein